MNLVILSKSDVTEIKINFSGFYCECKTWSYFRSFFLPETVIFRNFKEHGVSSNNFVSGLQCVQSSRVISAFIAYIEQSFEFCLHFNTHTNT